MATIDPTRRARLPLATRMFSGVGTVAFGIKDQGFGGFLMLYYNQVLGLSAAWVGTTIMIAMVADALFDPIVGHVSDNWRSRWGRRHPFMYASAIPLSICYFLVWAPPALDPAALSVYLLVIAILVRMIVSVYEIPSMALLSELSSDYDERTELVAWRYFFGVVGGIGITILTFKYFLVPTPSQPVGQLNPAGYFDYGIVASILIFVFVLASALGTHNRIDVHAAVVRIPIAQGRMVAHKADGQEAVRREIARLAEHGLVRRHQRRPHLPFRDLGRQLLAPGQQRQRLKDRRAIGQRPAERRERTFRRDEPLQMLAVALGALDGQLAPLGQVVLPERRLVASMTSSTWIIIGCITKEP
jgi:Na+/melibiose symporter-like transporter